MPRHTPNPADAARRLAGDLAMRLQTPLLPDSPEARLLAGYPDGLSSGEQALLAITSCIGTIGSECLYIDENLRRSVASTLRRLAEVVEP
jgi:hypothetical protein